MSFPNFALGPILILFFAIELGWLPVSGSGSLAHLVLPAITMGGALAAILTRMVRTSMLEELGQDYIRTARAKGLPERTVVYRHALRNAMIPILTVVGLQFGALLAGAIVTETIFSWPGIGRLTITAISNRDYYLVQGCILMIGLTYVAGELPDGSAVLGVQSPDSAIKQLRVSSFEVSSRPLLSSCHPERDRAGFARPSRRTHSRKMFPLNSGPSTRDKDSLARDDTLKLKLTTGNRQLTTVYSGRSICALCSVSE